MALIDAVVASLEDQTTFGFSEIRTDPSSLTEFDQNKKLLNTVTLFSFGSYDDYLQHRDDFIELSDAAIYKLKQLTLISEALKNNTLTYELLQRKLHIASIMELERLVVESIYAKIIDAKLFSKEKHLRVSTCNGRDVLLDDEPVPAYGNPTKVSDLLAGLEKFDRRIDKAFVYIEEIESQISKHHENFNVSETSSQPSDSALNDGRLPDGRRKSSGIILVPSQVSMSMPEVSQVNIASYNNGRKRKTQD